MRGRNIIAVSSLLMILIVLPLLGQYHEYAGDSGIGIPFFELIVHRQFALDSKSNLILVSTQFLYDDLTFVKSDSSGYDASIELLIAIYDKSDQVVTSKSIVKKINVKDFEITNSRDEKLFTKDILNIESGKYQVLIKALDLMSYKSAQRKIELNLPAYENRDVTISGIVFLQRVELDSAGNLLDFVPAYSNNFSGRFGAFYIYFDLYVKMAPTSVKIAYSMQHRKSKNTVDTVLVKKITQNTNTFLVKIDKDKLPFNNYTLKLKVESDEGEDSRELPFSFYWSDTPNTTGDIELALKQMTYIIPSDSLDKYEKASLEDQQIFFRRFWEQRDPDPATTKNELKNEYFKRVNYANQQFTAFGHEGWLTDRGRIFIKFGVPDDIERHPFEMGTTPYEIWRYYSLRKTFYFIDHSGFGDYRLHPSYLDMEFQ
jgi:GWxTD domain-containing protein